MYFLRLQRYDFYFVTCVSFYYNFVSKISILCYQNFWCASTAHWQGMEMFPRKTNVQKIVIEHKERQSTKT